MAGPGDSAQNVRESLATSSAFLCTLTPTSVFLFFLNTGAILVEPKMQTLTAEPKIRNTDTDCTMNEKTEKITVSHEMKEMVSGLL